MESAGMRASRTLVQGSTAGGPHASAGPTRVPTPGCRSRPAGLARGRRRNVVATGYRSARSDRPWLEVLDVISVPRSLAAPSGKAYVTNPGIDGSTLLSTRLGGEARALSTSSAAVWTDRGQLTDFLPAVSRRGRTSRSSGGGPSRPPGAPSSGRRALPRSPRHPRRARLPRLPPGAARAGRARSH